MLMNRPIRVIILSSLCPSAIKSKQQQVLLITIKRGRQLQVSDGDLWLAHERQLIASNHRISTQVAAGQLNYHSLTEHLAPNVPMVNFLQTTARFFSFSSFPLGGQ